MDPVTHTLLGAATGYFFYRRKLGRMAAAVGALAALAPDSDVFIRSSSDPLLEIEYHRHFTHALPFAPIGAALVAAFWLSHAKWRPLFPVLWLCALTSYVSHCLLDAATSYGTVLLWPLTRYRFGWDFISIVDPAFTLPLLIGLVWSMITKRARAAGIALSLAAAYMIWGAVQHSRAMSAQKQLAASRGHVMERREVMPTLANNVVWRALYLHEGRIYSDRFRVGWFSRPSVFKGWSLPRTTAADLTAEEQALDRKKNYFERFNWFSEGWVAREPKGSRVLGDMRYSLSTEAFDPIWGIRYTEPGAPTGIVWVSNTRDRQINFKEFWNEIIGKHPAYLPLFSATQRGD